MASRPARGSASVKAIFGLTVWKSRKVADPRVSGDRNGKIGKITPQTASGTNSNLCTGVGGSDGNSRSLIQTVCRPPAASPRWPRSAAPQAPTSSHRSVTKKIAGKRQPLGEFLGVLPGLVDKSTKEPVDDRSPVDYRQAITLPARRIPLRVLLGKLHPSLVDNLWSAR